MVQDVWIKKTSLYRIIILSLVHGIPKDGVGASGFTSSGKSIVRAQGFRIARKRSKPSQICLITIPDQFPTSRASRSAIPRFGFRRGSSAIFQSRRIDFLHPDWSDHKKNQIRVKLMYLDSRFPGIYSTPNSLREIWFWKFRLDLEHFFGRPWYLVSDFIPELICVVHWRKRTQSWNGQKPVSISISLITSSWTPPAKKHSYSPRNGTSGMQRLNSLSSK